MQLIEKYSRESPTWGRLAMNATVKMPRASNLAEVDGTIAVEVVPQSAISDDTIAAATRAAMLKDNETILISLDATAVCNAFEGEEGS
jgi:hypothetical protein